MELVKVTGWFRRLHLRYKLRRALASSAHETAALLAPQGEHQDDGYVQSATPGAKVPQFRKAEAAAEWSEDVDAHNRAIAWAAQLELLEWWAACLKGERKPRFQVTADRLRAGGMLTAPQAARVESDYRLDGWVCRYFALQLEQGYAQRQNVTGLGPKMPRLQPGEIADAREASQVQGQIDAIERRRWAPTPKQEQQLEGTILDALGGDAEILERCGGNAELAAQVKAKARSLFAGAEQ